MIFYFTATGNSRLVASELAHLLQQEAYDLTAVLPDTFHHNETVGIVCPVHAWGVPSIMPALLQKICLPLQRADYIYVILCCGDDIGYADNHIRKMLASIDVVPDALFSVCMPNTYVALPGFDVDTLSQQQHKLENARKRIENIAIMADDNQRTAVFLQMVFQPHSGFQIQMVGRLVQQQYVRRLKQCRRQSQPHTPASGKLFYRARKIFVFETEAV